jgi:isopenicillin-N epimerase
MEADRCGVKNTTQHMSPVAEHAATNLLADERTRPPEAGRLTGLIDAEAGAPADLDQALEAKRRSLAFAPKPHLLRHWTLDPALTFLNHGSYGSVPVAAQRAQAELRERVERDPVRFFKVDLELLMDGVRERLGQLLNCPPADLAPISNATHALCTIVAATDLRRGDEVLVTDHEYGSLFNELERVCARTGAVVVRAKVPFPIASPQEVLERVAASFTPRTRLVAVSHITSASSLIFPAGAIIRECHARGVDVVLDGAHSPGQIPVDVRALAPTYFVTSGHKWLCAPKGTAFMYVRPDKQRLFRPLALSSRANKIRPERALFLRDFDYQGTADYSGALTIPHSIEALSAMLPGGWSGMLRANHTLALEGRRVVCEALGCEPPAPEAMVGSMATMLIPEPPEHRRNAPTVYDDALQDALYERHRIVVPIWRLGSTDQRVVRISAHLYNSLEQYELLGRALRQELCREWA